MKKTPFNPDFLPAPVASFNRALELEFEKIRLLFISGTASVGPERQTMYAEDFESQAKHAYSNIKQILAGKEFGIGDVVRWKIYLKDIARHYAAFNKIRDEFFKENGIPRESMGASTCVEARLCREDLLVEIEAIALKEI